MNIKNLSHSSTNEEVFNLIDQGKIIFYLGIDPTGDSLHIGHLATLVFAKRLMQKGNTPIVLIGGMTAMIGDPSGKSKERNLLDEEAIQHNVKALTKQINNFFGSKVEIKNNFDWLNISLTSFLRDYGKQFNINNMIKKDIVASRLENGISLTEFSYQALQAMDFAHLVENHNCNLQIGGQDQWGNIITGLDLIRKRKVSEKKAFGITIPLITKTDGTKFGKTESEAVWLSPDKTSPYELFQFLFNTPDNEVINLVKYLTLASSDKIQALENSIKLDSSKREAQTVLSEEVINLIYGKETLERVKEITKLLFIGDVASLTLEEINNCLSDVPSTTLKGEVDVQEFLVQSTAAKSRREAREFIESNSVMINGNKIKDPEMIISKKNSLHGEIHIIKRGKRKYFLGKY